MNILITGITGFIGGHLCQRLLDDEKHEIVALIRPHTQKARYERFVNAVQMIEADLTDQAAIDRIMTEHHIDCVFHIAAMRGGGAASPEEFDNANIQAPIVLAEAALTHQAKYIFCSSAGVFGTIPARLPPDETTLRNPDNYYHYTKIEAERRLHDLEKQGVHLVIIRPIITYGSGDRGFPFLLVQLVDRGLLLLPTQDIRIHLVSVETLVEAFVQAAVRPEAVGKCYTITDNSPVSLRAFVNHIATQLHGQPYPDWKRFPTPLYRLGEFFFERILNNDAWKTRVKLMSRDWYYDGSKAAKELQLHLKDTFSGIEDVITYYSSANEGDVFRQG